MLFVTVKKCVEHILVGLKSIVRRRINAPVAKLSKKVQKEVAKTVLPQEKPASVDEITDTHGAVSTSAHSNSRVPNNVEAEPARSSTSTKSSKSSKSKSKLPTFAPAAPAQVGVARSQDRVGGGEDEDEDNDFDENGFNHPSTYAEQPWIWVPKDPYGISKVLVQELQGASVQASDIGATMDEHGTVEVERNPPDEEWSGGHDA
ncbi:hypothetical protein K474DRAFT_1285297 [Panus rudis PR-1116 ss-1]|nr:hypothetical protein K474DRAFT_1285297 [Panus rudis PR-1116 ss-1]